MNFSIFDVLGPVMIGPSSSHTAGAAKLAKTAMMIYGKKFNKVVFELGGSFAQTYKGHGTDYALLAGILGYDEDDELLKQAFDIAKKQGLEFDFLKTDEEVIHENFVRIIFPQDEDNFEDYFIEGASIGGGRILITNINSLECEISASCPTIVVEQIDVKGVVSQVTGILAKHNINIAVMKLTRVGRGGIAYCVFECDEQIPEIIYEQLMQVEAVQSVMLLNL